jgi:hypothetical protein
MRALLSLLLTLFACNVASAQFVQDLEVGKSAHAFHGGISGNIKTFQSDKEAVDVVRGIMTSMGLPLRFEVRAGAVPNASAILTNDGQRLIVYNVIFMEEIRSKTGEYWSLISIMAHEIGHHLSFHMSSQIDDHVAELEADYFSGFVLGKLGAKLDQALAAMRELSSPLPSKTHPKRDDRLQSIAVGWKSATANRQPNPLEGVQPVQPASTAPVVRIPQDERPPSRWSNGRWDHNNSEMSLEVGNDTVRIYYQSPRQGMRDEGVRQGTLLFEGTFSGRQISGTAHLFSRTCGRFPYAVSGAMSEDGRRIDMSGSAPTIDTGCRVTGRRRDDLAFTRR